MAANLTATERAAELLLERLGLGDNVISIPQAAQALTDLNLLPQSPDPYGVIGAWFTAEHGQPVAQAALERLHDQLTGAGIGFTVGGAPVDATPG